MAKHAKETHQLVDLAFDAMFSRDFERKLITFWNEGAERLYGWSREEAIGKMPRELLASQYPMPLEEIEKELIKHGRWEGDIVQRRKDGSPIVVRGRWGLQLDVEGRPSAILEINSDMSSAQQVARSEERFSQLVSAVADYAIFMLDPSGIVTSWNEGAKRIKGYSAEEIIGRHFSAFYTPEDVANGKPDRALETAVREGRFLDEGWRRRKDGSRFWASVVITAMRDPDGTLHGFGKVTRDITDRHHHEETLRKHAAQMADLEQAKTQFLHLAAHELRGPLTLIRGYNAMLVAGGLAPERITQIAQILEGRLAQVDLLVEQMLEMARLENRSLELHMEEFDLVELARAEMTKFRSVAIRHQLVLVDGDGPAVVRADRSRVSTIVGNLLDNAIKYSPAGGEIRCVVGTKGGMRFVTVADHGLGIASHHMPLLFKRFSRLPTEENKTIHGTGLALFLCQEIAHRLHGEIDVTSELHEGSEFTLRLPLHEAAAQGLS